MVQVLFFPLQMLKRCNMVNIKTVILEISNSLKDFKSKRLKKLHSQENSMYQSLKNIIQSLSFAILFKGIRSTRLSQNSVFFTLNLEKFVVKFLPKVSILSFQLISSLILCLSHKLNKFFKNLIFVSYIFDIIIAGGIVKEKYI